MGGAEPAGAARDAGRRACGIEDFERADRRHHHRQAQFAAEHLDRGVDPGDIAQHARPECDLVERHAVAAHRGLGLGGADDIVPGILVEVGARLAHEFVKVLERLGAGAEFTCLPGIRGCFVHFFLLVFPTAPGLEHPFFSVSRPPRKTVQRVSGMPGPRFQCRREGRAF